MTKKALCVGINNYPYGDDNDLRGCLNDANDWAALLRDRYDFTDVQMLTDDQATKRNVIAGLKNLLAGASPGDVLAFTNASHGTYIAEDGSDPSFDEALCPYDDDQNSIIDDELRELFAGLPRGVRLTVVSDSCHSGTVTRVRLAKGFRRRMLPPEVRGARVLTPAEFRAARKKKRQEDGGKYPQSGMKEVLLSGCRDTQTSADAEIEGDYHGAMTFYALQAIREADYQLTYAELHERLREMLYEEGFDQEPQLEGTDENKHRQIFT